MKQEAVNSLYSGPLTLVLVRSINRRKVATSDGNEWYDILRAALHKYGLSSFGREKIKSVKLSQKNSLYK